MLKMRVPVLLALLTLTVWPTWWSVLWLPLSDDRNLVFWPSQSATRCEVKRQIASIILSRNAIPAGWYLIGHCQELPVMTTESEERRP